MINPTRAWIQEQVLLYVEGLLDYLRLNKLTPLAALGVDHGAIKVTDGDEYDRILPALQAMSASGQYVVMNERRLATLQLREPIKYGTFGESYYLEVMQPRPAKVGSDLVGFEHAEILVDNLDRCEREVQASGAVYERVDNGQHKAIVVRLNPSGQEIKFTDTPIALVLEREKEAGLLSPLF